MVVVIRTTASRGASMSPFGGVSGPARAEGDVSLIIKSVTVRHAISLPEMTKHDMPLPFDRRKRM